MLAVAASNIMYVVWAFLVIFIVGYGNLMLPFIVLLRGNLSARKIPISSLIYTTFLALYIHSRGWCLDII
jgi:hypothetical protein